MDYSTVIEMSNVTIQDCIDLYEKKNITTKINDGSITDFLKDGD